MSLNLYSKTCKTSASPAKNAKENLNTVQISKIQFYNHYQLKEQKVSLMDIVLHQIVSTILIGNLTINISTTFLGLYSNDIINNVNKQNNFTFTYNVRVSWFTDE